MSRIEKIGFGKMELQSNFNNQFKGGKKSNKILSIFLRLTIIKNRNKIMKTIVLEVSDNKCDFIVNLLNEFPFAKIKNTFELEKSNNSKSIEELLKEGYLASNQEDLEITNDFVFIDLENWD